MASQPEEMALSPYYGRSKTTSGKGTEHFHPVPGMLASKTQETCPSSICSTHCIIRMSEIADNGTRKLQPKITPHRDEYFMGTILVEAVMCRDPIAQKAALIVDHKDRRVGFGINFIPKEFNTIKGYGWDERSRELALVHAEEAAIDTALKRYIPGGQAHLEVFYRHTMYVNGPPSLRGVRRARYISL